MVSTDAGEVTVTIKAIDQASEVIADVAHSLELLETAPDWRPTIGAFLGAFAAVFAALLLGGSL